MFVKVQIGRTGAKTRHADENPVFANDRIPALANGSFDADPDGGAANNLLPRIVVLCQEKIHARHGHDPRGNSPRGQKVPRIEREGDFRAGGGETSEPEAKIETWAGPPSAGATS